MRNQKSSVIRILVVLLAFTCNASAQTDPGTSCKPVKDALNVLENINPGDSRAKLERDFQQDGGLQSAGKTRYVFKQCKFIKVLVEFSGDGLDSRTEFLPNDKIVKISKPYLEYPVRD